MGQGGRLTHVITPASVKLPLKPVPGKPSRGLHVEAFGHTQVSLQAAKAGWPLGFVLCPGAEGGELGSVAGLRSQTVFVIATSFSTSGS